MGRIRSIKPEFPQSETLGRCSRDARLLFVLLWTICDDEGRTRAASRMLASLLFPYDDDAPKLIDGWIAELEREQCIATYIVEGTHYIQVVKWLNHQKIDRPTPSKLPQFDESSRNLASPRRVLDADLDLGRDMDQDRERDARATEPGLACVAMREAGCARTNPSNPNLLAALTEGVTSQVLADTVREAIERKIGEPFSWAIKTARSRHAAGTETINARAGPSQQKPQSRTAQAIAALEAMKPHEHRSRTVVQSSNLEGPATPALPIVGRAAIG